MTNQKKGVVTIPPFISEVVVKIMEHAEEVFDFDRYDSNIAVRMHDNLLREKLTAVYERGKVEAFKEALQLVDRHDPNIGMGRETSTLYWGNTLRNALLALTTEGK